MAALSGEKTLAELSAEFGVHPTMISNWKQELVTRAGELFGRGSKAPAADDAQKVIDDLHRQDRAAAGRVRFNFPVDKMGTGYATLWNAFKHITAGCSQIEKLALYSGTAKRLYHLD